MRSVFLWYAPIRSCLTRVVSTISGSCPQRREGLMDVPPLVTGFEGPPNLSCLAPQTPSR
jgi:hypothetical protein